MVLLCCSRCAAVALQVAELVAVWVSHRHADHMAGLPGILAARASSKPPLLVSCVLYQMVLRWLHSSSSSVSGPSLLSPATTAWVKGQLCFMHKYCVHFSGGLASGASGNQGFHALCQKPFGALALQGCHGWRRSLARMQRGSGLLRRRLRWACGIASWPAARLMRWRTLSGEKFCGRLVRALLHRCRRACL